MPTDEEVPVIYDTCRMNSMSYQSAAKPFNEADRYSPNHHLTVLPNDTKFAHSSRLQGLRLQLQVADSSTVLA
jgi:hypothetical protein